jgi:hypothetical protein
MDHLLVEEVIELSANALAHFVLVLVENFAVEVWKLCH